MKTHRTHLLSKPPASGQGLVEYTLILVLVSISAYLALQNLGIKIDGKIDEVSAVVSGTGTGNHGMDANAPSNPIGDPP